MLNCLSSSYIQNKVQYGMYHRINMSDFSSDLKDTSFVKSPDNAEVDYYHQLQSRALDAIFQHPPQP